MSMTRWPYSTARAAWLATAHKANRLRNLYVLPRNVRSRRRADPGASGYALRPRIADQVKPDNLCATEPDSSICYRPPTAAKGAACSAEGLSYSHAPELRNRLGRRA